MGTATPARQLTPRPGQFDAGPTPTGTQPPGATCSAASLAACTHYLATGKEYEETTAFPVPPRNRPRRLDNFTASDVYISLATAPATRHRIVDHGSDAH
jgi:hypothetical protein